MHRALLWCALAYCARAFPLRRHRVFGRSQPANVIERQKMLQVIETQFTSGLSTLNEDQIAERGARLARRDDQEYRECLREEQRSQTGCPAREVVVDQRGQATSPPERWRE